MDITPASLNEFLRGAFPASADDGFVCEEVSPGAVLIRWPLDPSKLRPGGYIPGPTQFAIADLALWFAVFTAIGVEPMAVTSDLAITFLRPAVHGDLLARARLKRVGSTRIYGEIDIWTEGNEDRPCAHATGHYTNPTGRRDTAPEG